LVAWAEKRLLTIYQEELKALSEVKEAVSSTIEGVSSLAVA
jgi:hypothetical protein